MRSPSRLIVIVAILSLFALTALVAVYGFTQQADAELALIMNADGGETFTALMTLISQLGREHVWLPLVVLMFVLGNRNARILAIELAILLLIGAVLGQALKTSVERSRPFEAVPGIVLRADASEGSSFPSGHALTVSIGAVFSLLRFRRIFSLPLTIEAVMVCYSRVYLGVHYPLDVFAGIVLGVSITLLGLYAVERYARGGIETFASALERRFH